MNSERAAIWVNGTKSDCIPAFDHGFLYGDAVFDTYRIFSGRPFYAEQHLARLFASAESVGITIPYSAQRLMEDADAAYRELSCVDAFVRIVVSRGAALNGLATALEPTAVIFVTERPFKPLQKVPVAISGKPKFSRDHFGMGIKSTGYGISARELHLAKQRGFSDVIFKNEFGFISEATTSNVFAVIDGILKTPPLESGALPGITRSIILDRFPVVQEKISVEDVMRADEIFLSGTANFITSVSKIEECTLNQFSKAEDVCRYLNSLQ